MGIRIGARLLLDRRRTFSHAQAMQQTGNCQKSASLLHLKWKMLYLLYILIN
jgi:hypothetical protein